MTLISPVKCMTGSFFY